MRPTGSRPAPFSTVNSTVTHHQTTSRQSDSTPLTHSEQDEVQSTEGNHNDFIQYQNAKHSKTVSFSPSVRSKSRPLAHGPNRSMSSLRSTRKFSSTSVIDHSPSEEQTYLENTTRQLEREEAYTLREALKIIDHRDEEKRLYEAAQQEAAELVWKHRNPQLAEDEKFSAYRNPDVSRRKSYGQDLQQQPISPFMLPRSVSDSSTSSRESAQSNSNGSTGSRPKSKFQDQTLKNALNQLQSHSTERSAHIIAMARDHRRRSSGQRMVSNGSSKGVFRNPEDQIYEEPEPIDNGIGLHNQPRVDLPLRSRPENPLLRGQRPLPEKPYNTIPVVKPMHDRFEIHRNPPSQSRNAAYTLNTPPPKINLPEDASESPKENVEIRSEDIRAATSMKLKDRSSKLPTPTAVSDRPGRPIVSFDPSWRSGTESPRSNHENDALIGRNEQFTRSSRDLERPQSRPTSQPVVPVPTICFPDDGPSVPVINIENTEGPSSNSTVPSIQVSEDINPAPRALPTPNKGVLPKPLPPKSASLPWLNSGSRSGTPTVSCASCSLPIAGRIVTASGSKSSSLKARFHPECFTCFHCSTPLECVSFYPEPDNKRIERFESEGIHVDAPESDLRFYCHLDFHEFFSPRCRSCKTPIEGEIIIAAGAEWHVGHFFCGECGDPFDSNTPFVEKDGYAYCVPCHTKRTSARCRECKKQILDDLTVEALGGKWHEACFSCYECGSGFGDDGSFFVRDISIEPTEKEKRRGLTKKFEEKAVCAACEERRLKA